MGKFKSRHIFLIVSFYYLCLIHPILSSTVNILESNSKVHVLPEVGKFGFAVEKMNTFCYEGVPKEIAHLLKTVMLIIDIEEDDFNCYHGVSPEEVKSAQESHKSIFSFNLFSHSKKRNVKLNPFNKTCIGIETSSEYIVTLQQLRVDLVKFGLLGGGILLFFLSAKLSRNSAFFYICGVLLGVFASVLVLIWFVTKLIPKKTLMYGALLSGWALVAYFAQIVFDNIQPMLIIYRKYVAIYILTTSLISFGVCYYMGPPKNQRSKRLIMWSLQLCGLLAIFSSSDFHEAVIGIIGACVVIYYFPTDRLPSFRRLKNRFFPPKPKLLTKEEFEELGRTETEKALKQLREYVRSPNCKQWKVVKNLSQPMRFASFVEGDAHITHDETVDYENTMHDLSFSDTDSDSSVIEESIAVDESMNVINKSKAKMLQSLKKPDMHRNLSRIKTSTPTSNGRPKRNGLINRTGNAYELSEDDD